MNYRKGTQKDLTEIYELVKTSIEETYPQYYLQEIIDMFLVLHSKENIQKDIVEGNLYVLENERGILIATGTVNGNHINRVYVHPQFQRKGYGTKIMHELEKEVEKRYARVEIDASLPACRLYERLGYQTKCHETWDCGNGVIQIYEVMWKMLGMENLRLRPFKAMDAKHIVIWCKDEYTFRQWSADRWESFPLTPEVMIKKYTEENGDCVEKDNFYPLTLTDGDMPVGHMILRYTKQDKNTIRFGFVIVNPEYRGMGYGQRMLQLAKSYAIHILGAKKITLGVFANNPAAHMCYQAVGFADLPSDEDVYYEVMGEKWRCIEMEIKKMHSNDM